MAEGLVNGLGLLHSLNYVHRDIKPDNIMFTAAGVVKVGQVGIVVGRELATNYSRSSTLDWLERPQTCSQT